VVSAAAAAAAAAEAAEAAAAAAVALSLCATALVLGLISASLIGQGQAPTTMAHRLATLIRRRSLLKRRPE
jgi:hypothetical protein